jgi:hypothetical protein
VKKTIKTCCSVFLYFALSILIIVGIVIAIQLHQTAMLNSKCDLPCWYGITVGETQKDEAIQVISGFSKVHYNISNNYSDKYFGTIDSVYFRLYPLITYLPTIDGDVYFKENETVYLSFGGNVGLKVNQVIEKFGEPEFVYVDPIYVRYQRAYIFYPEDGIIFTIGKLYNFHNIEENSKIMGIHIIKPENFQLFVENSGIYPKEEQYGPLFVPWSGYGELEGKYWFPNGLEE